MSNRFDFNQFHIFSESMAKLSARGSVTTLYVKTTVRECAVHKIKNTGNIILCNLRTSSHRLR